MLENGPLTGLENENSVSNIPPLPCKESIMQLLQRQACSASIDAFPGLTVNSRKCMFTPLFCSVATGFCSWNTVPAAQRAPSLTSLGSVLYKADGVSFLNESPDYAPSLQHSIIHRAVIHAYIRFILIWSCLPAQPPLLFLFSLALYITAKPSSCLS